LGSNIAGVTSFPENSPVLPHASSLLTISGVNTRFGGINIVLGIIVSSSWDNPKLPSIWLLPE
jgi:hypothetical protein